MAMELLEVREAAMAKYFTMMSVVSSDEKKDFTQLRSELEEFGQSLHVKINIQSAAIFDAMHNL